MDWHPEYRLDPPRIAFRFAASGQSHAGSISLDALAALAGIPVHNAEEATLAYFNHWRHVHSAALGLRAKGQKLPFVSREDVE